MASGENSNSNHESKMQNTAAEELQFMAFYTFLPVCVGACVCKTERKCTRQYLKQQHERVTLYCVSKEKIQRHSQTKIVDGH